MNKLTTHSTINVTVAFLATVAFGIFLGIQLATPAPINVPVAPTSFTTSTYRPVTMPPLNQPINAGDNILNN